MSGRAVWHKANAPTGRRGGARARGIGFER